MRTVRIGTMSYDAGVYPSRNINSWWQLACAHQDVRGRHTWVWLHKWVFVAQMGMAAHMGVVAHMGRALGTMVSRHAAGATPCQHGLAFMHSATRLVGFNCTMQMQEQSLPFIPDASGKMCTVVAPPMVPVTAAAQASCHCCGSCPVTAVAPVYCHWCGSCALSLVRLIRPLSLVQTRPCCPESSCRWFLHSVA